jgi:hypothetical protein
MPEIFGGGGMAAGTQLRRSVIFSRRKVFENPPANGSQSIIDLDHFS